jgi:Arc/MetJ family transcription regulator
MRTNIEIDDALIRRALELTGLGTKKAVVERALAELVERKSREALADAFGKYPTDTDPEELDDVPEWVGHDVGR